MTTAVQQLAADWFGQSFNPQETPVPVALLHLAQGIDAGGAGGPVTASTALIGTGTVSGLPYQFQSAMNFDPSTGPAFSRRTMFNTTLSYASTTTNIWEGVTMFTSVSGPGTATGEINVLHTYLEIEAGAIINQAENNEISMHNFGTISGGWAGQIVLPVNESAATAANLIGTKYALTNANAASGSIALYAAIDNEAMSGGGSLPTTYLFLRNADANAAIVTLGAMAIGALAAPAAGISLQINGAGSDSSTFPLLIKNAAAANAFYVDDGGTVHALTSYVVAASQVVSARQTGWSAMTGTPNLAAVYDTSSVTLAQLAGRVMALQAGLTTHGLIGP